MLKFPLGELLALTCFWAHISNGGLEYAALLPIRNVLEGVPPGYFLNNLE